MNIEAMKLFLVVASESQVKKFNIIDALTKKESQVSIARKFGVTRGYVNQIQHDCSAITK